jgi:uncharacterized protein DUF4382
MRLSGLNLRNAFAAMIIAAGLAGCSDSCFVAFSNNGKGGLNVKVGDPAPVCSLSKTQAAIRVAALKSPVCETCTAAAQVEHVFIAVRSIQLRSSAGSDSNSADWVEIAPMLASEPRQVDLIGTAMPEMLVENARVPAESYHELRLQFLAESPSNAEKLNAENACGESRWNCIVMGDGHIEPLRLSRDAPELDIVIQSAEGDSFTLLPDTSTDLRLFLELRQAFYFSNAEGWKPQNVLAGRALAVRQKPLDADSAY